MGPEVSAKFVAAGLEASGPSRTRRDLARQCEGTAPEVFHRAKTNDLKTVVGKVPRGLTNEVQRRAKRVRCNAGLGPAAVSRPSTPDTRSHQEPGRVPWIAEAMHRALDPAAQ